MEVEEEMEALKAILGEETIFWDSTGRAVSVRYADLVDGMEVVYTLPGTASVRAVRTRVRR